MSHEEENFEADPKMRETQTEESGSSQVIDQLKDPELTSLLQRWKAPNVSPALDSRMAASYRQMFPARPQSRGSVFAMPLTRRGALVAAASMSLLLVAIFLKIHHQKPAMQVAGQQEFPFVQQMAVDNSADGARYSTYINLSGFKPVQPVPVHISRKER